jgi:hypothetical protein
MNNSKPLRKSHSEPNGNGVQDEAAAHMSGNTKPHIDHPPLSTTHHQQKSPGTPAVLAALSVGASATLFDPTEEVVSGPFPVQTLRRFG